MTKQTAIKSRVEVGEDHTVKLPPDVPVGPAWVIVLVDEAPAPRAANGLLGLFADEPEIVDEAMAYVWARRKEWRTGPNT